MKIINLVGASGSGKSSLANMADANVIQSYTTRPRRYEGECGHEFVDSYESREDVVAYANLYGEHYWALEEQFKESELNIYVVNPEGAIEVHEYFEDREDVEVITIYIQVDESVRAERLMARDGNLRRLEADRELFNVIECNYTVNGNGELWEVFKACRMIWRL